jgi:site-specific recombinase XerD
VKRREFSSELVKEFIENNAGNENTRDAYKKRLKQFFKVLGVTNIDNYFQSNRDYLKDYKTFASSIRNLAPRSQVCYLNTIKVFFEDRGIDLPKREIKKIRNVNQIRQARSVIDSRTPNREELKIILTRADVKAKALVQFLSSTGMRIGEALSIRFNDLDWENRSVKIRREIAKGGYSRRTFFTKEAKDVLIQWIEKDRKIFLERRYNKSVFVRDELEAEGYTLKQVGDGWVVYEDGKRVSKELLIERETRLFPFSYSNALLIWYHLLEKAGHPFNQKDGKYYMYNIHCLRRFWWSYFKVSEEFRDEKNYMFGHLSSLDNAYFNGEFDKLKNVYEAGMNSITLFSDADRVISELQPELNVQGREIRKLLVKNELLEQEIDELLKLMYYATGEPPITDEQKKMREVFRQKLEKRLSRGSL